MLSTVNGKPEYAYEIPTWHVIQKEIWRECGKVSTQSNAQHFEDLQSLDGVSFSFKCSDLLLQFTQKSTKSLHLSVNRSRE